MVGFLRPATTSAGGQPFQQAVYYNSEIQDGVQGGRRILKSSYE